MHWSNAKVMLLAVLTLSAISLAGDPGVTDDAIVLGSHAVLSGPTAFYSSVTKAAEAYFKMINDQGGIHGRKIVFKYEDDGYVPARTVEVVRKLVERDQVFAIAVGMGTPNHAAVMKYLVQKKVPDMFPIAGGTFLTWPKENGYKPYKTAFGAFPTFANEGYVMATYAAKNWPGKKAALFYQNDDAGKEFASALKEYAAGKIKIVSDEVYDPQSVDVSAQVLKAKSMDADIVFSWATPKFIGGYLKKAHEMGWKPTYMISLVSYNPVTWALAGPDCKMGEFKDCSASDGAYFNKVLPSFAEKDNPKVKRHYEIMEKYAPGLKVDNFTIYGQGCAELVVEALKRAGRNLTRQKLIEGAEQIRGWNEGLFPDVEMGPNDHAATEKIKIAQVKGGIASDVTDFMATKRPGK